ncbi:type IV secretory system conjugative DNA transfer family protein [Nitrobacter sp. JJSN]|uniref:type IV secretory system conjugative DNA transfer family protein n=1 Tax=Nitrobacter sp. JJSN TaxID=3453033 RepID=UPI003F76DEF2
MALGDGFDLGSIFGGGKKASGGGARWGFQVANKIGHSIATRIEQKRMEREVEAENARHRERLANPPPLHGSSDWASLEELRAARVMAPMSGFDNPSSIILGSYQDELRTPDEYVHWDGVGHLMTLAPTRTGKSETTIVPNLLRYRGAAVVLDPKGELFQLTSAWRQREVGPVYRISPFEAQSHSYNPIAHVRDEGEARSLADVLIPDDLQASGFFKKDAVAFMTALIQFIRETTPAHLQCLALVRHLSTSKDRLLNVAAEMVKFSNIPNVRDAGDAILSKSKDVGLPSLIATLNAELSCFGLDNVRRVTERNDFDFRTIKRDNATVYIQVPLAHMNSYAPFVRTLLTSALDAQLDTPASQYQALFVLDEFLALKTFQKFQDAIRTHASYGVRLWFFLQELAELERLYPTSWKGFFNTSVKQFFGTDETFTGEIISKQLGETTVAYENSSVTGNVNSTTSPGYDRTGHRGSTVNRSVQYSARPLLTPAEVREYLIEWLPDGTRNSIVMTRDSKRPIRTRLSTYKHLEYCTSRLGAATLHFQQRQT